MLADKIEEFYCLHFCMIYAQHLTIFDSNNTRKCWIWHKHASNGLNPTFSKNCTDALEVHFAVEKMTLLERCDRKNHSNLEGVSESYQRLRRFHRRKQSTRI